MRYLLDTCVLDELRRVSPDERLVEWIGQIHESHLCLSVLILAEIEKEIMQLHDVHQKQILQRWLEQDLEERFVGRILPVDLRVALEWGAIQAMLTCFEKPVCIIDSLLAATAKCHNLTLVTKRTDSFDLFPVRVINPWL